MANGVWRPANLTDLTDKSAAHVVNQLFRETNIRIDNVEKHQTVGYSGQATLIFGAISAGACLERPVNIIGVNQGLVPHATPTVDVGANLSWSSRIGGANQVLVRVCNPTSAPVTPHAVQWKVSVNQ